MHVVRAHNDDLRFYCGRKRWKDARGSGEVAFVHQLCSESVMLRRSVAVARRCSNGWDEYTVCWPLRSCLRLLVWNVYFHHSVKAKQKDSVF